MKKKKIEELIASNERQKLYKQNQLVEQAKQEQEEHERIVKQYLEETEKERRAEEDKQKKLYENTQDLKKLIKLKEEKERLHSKEKLEDGRKMKQNADDWYMRMEKIKRQKIQDLKNLGVQPKYIVDLERYKIV